MPSASVSGEVQAPQGEGGRHEPHAGTHAYGRAGRRGYYRESGIFAHEEPFADQGKLLGREVLTESAGP
jgi:hypothetical protein